MTALGARPARLVNQRLSIQSRRPQNCLPSQSQNWAIRTRDRYRGRIASSRGGAAVIPGPFAYHRPKSVTEAVAMLAELGEEARPLAGGHSLIPMMKLRIAAPEHLIDLGGIGDLKGIRADGGDIVIGAMTTQHELVDSDLLAARIPII